MVGDHVAVLLLAALSFVLVHTAATNDFLSIFTEKTDSSSNLRNVVYDYKSQKLYVGATNVIYRLNANLQADGTVITGPQYDIINCSTFHLSSCSRSSAISSSVNQALAIDAAGNSVIACGTLFYGTCISVNLNSFNGSSVSYETFQPVVPYDTTKSSVSLLVAPGADKANALFVAASYSRSMMMGSGSFLSKIVFLSSRDLNTFELLQRDQSAASAIDVLKSYQENFDFMFRHMLYFSNNTYIFAVRPMTISSTELTSHILRVCNNNPKLVSSFVEIPLECQVGDVVYKYLRGIATRKLDSMILINNGQTTLDKNTDLVFGAFTISKDNVGHSAICAYRMTDIEKVFQQVVQTCFLGQGKLGPEYITAVRQCTRTDIQIPLTFCGTESYNYPIVSASSSLKSVISRTVRDTIITSLQVEDVNSKVVALAGTNDGRLSKVTLVSSTVVGNEAFTYAVVDSKLDAPSPVKTVIRAPTGVLYMHMDKAIVGVRLNNCSLMSSCEECVKDPYCGWCLPTARCSVLANCTNGGLWVNTVCPTVISFRPAQIAAVDLQNASVRLTVYGVPNTFRNITCAFKSQTYRSLAVISPWSGDNSSREITCSHFTPPTAFSLFVNLSLTLSVNSSVFAAVPITVYSCSDISSCTSCTKSAFGCRWCVITHKCAPSTRTCGTFEAIGSESQCPIFSISKSSNSLPSDRIVNLTISGKNFVMSYADNRPLVNVLVDIIYKDHHVLDHPNVTSVEVYKCRHMVSNCGKCVTLDPKYGCSWCDNQFCSLQEECKSGSWMTEADICLNPQILSFSPVGGPLKGGTRLTVTGVNLGRTLSQLTVSVASKTCNVTGDEWIASERFVCVTESVDAAVESAVSINVNGVVTANSLSAYSFMDPVVTEWHPKKGPCSGGTLITLNGTNLHYGSNFAVKIADSLAQVLRRSASNVDIITPSYPISGQSSVNVPVTVNVDSSGNLSSLPQMKFTYLEDPVINSIDSCLSIVSGGNQLEIKGNNLQSVQKPLFVIYYNNKNLTAPCSFLASHRLYMYCETPDFNEFRHVFNSSTRKISVDYGFIMDGVQNMRLVRDSVMCRSEPFRYLPDPKILAFSSIIQYKEGMMLEIMGENLEMYDGFHKGVKILVGGGECQAMKTVSDTKITCEPPAANSKWVDENGNAVIQFKLGNFVKVLGHLSYFDYGPPYGLIFGLICGLGIPLLAGIIILVYCWRKKKPHRKPSGPIVVAPRPRFDNPAPRVNDYHSAETVPLQQMKTNNTVPDDEDLAKDDAHYFQELLKKIDKPRLRNAAKEVYIARERLEIGNLLGKGHFGCVYAATLRDTAMKNPVPVAVKTIEESDLDQKMVENFIQEGIIMKNFNHPHVLSLLGLCLGYHKEPMVILPFMANGDLRSFVKDKSRMFTARQLLQLAQQVAEGMSYLSSLNFIHRDLAARNCMIDDKNQVKVADFGLSRQLFEREYYSSKDHKAKLPVKWMALESLEDFIFTAKSDVWSFGVLMWELMTRGVTPYPDIEVSETRSYLASGKRLHKPKYCPDNVYAIMVDCWHEVPERRPTFTDLVNRLELLLNPPKKNRTSIKEDDEPTYINVADTAEVHDYLHPINKTSAAAEA